ncbi:MAG: tRNA lysidine(34) synthetase TilS [Actinobacteria bacterium]|nr:tRNA lysidine(34) synthetase TilS [Actinomycetota bacterium]
MRWEKERFAVIHRVSMTLRRWSMLRPGDRVVVAVSGGADSLVLLDVLNELAPLEGVTLTVLHVDHGLRPRSGEEAAFVEEVAARYRLPFHAEKVDVPARESGMSPEEAAREARYRAFAREMERTGAQGLATGHTADDRVETVLLRLFAGAGPGGLGGIPPRRDRYIRPLIEVWRREIEAYVPFLPFTPLQDPTNRDLAVPRNYVRHVLLPFLEERYPAVRRVLLREAEALREVGELLEGLAVEAEGELLVESRQGVEVALEPLLSLHPAVRRQVLARLLRRAGVEPDCHIMENITELAGAAGGCASLDVGGDKVLRREYGRLVLADREVTEPATGGTAPGELLVTGEGRYPLPEEGAELHLTVRPRSGPPRLPGREERLTAVLDADLLSFPLKVRCVRPGDRFHPLGAPGMRKLQDFLVDCKVPRGARGRVRVLECGRGIAWVIGHRIDDRFKVTGDTRRLAVIRIEAASK